MAAKVHVCSSGENVLSYRFVQKYGSHMLVLVHVSPVVKKEAVRKEIKCLRRGNSRTFRIEKTSFKY